MNKKRNEMLVNKIRDFLVKEELTGDVRIYFNNMCYSWDSDGDTYEILKDIKSSDYFEGANDELVSMTFEGDFYDMINMYYGSSIADKFRNLLKKTDFATNFIIYGIYLFMRYSKNYIQKKTTYFL